MVEKGRAIFKFPNDYMEQGLLAYSAHLRTLGEKRLDCLSLLHLLLT